MADSQTIKRTIEQAKQGDREAVSFLYQTYVEQIYRYIAYRVNSEQDAEDLTAEVFVKMVEGLHNYQDKGAPFEAWLYRIAHARVIDLRRRDNRRPQAELEEELVSEASPIEDDLQRADEHDEIRQAMSNLSDDDQTVLILRFVERKSHQEVAQLLGKSVSAVKSAQHRALTRLAELLGETKVRHYLRGQND